MHAEPAPAPAEAQAEINEQLWAGEDLVEHYTGRTLRPPEVMMLVRYRDALSGRVLELGCGGGRLSGYLNELARDFHGLDISPLMVAHCRGLYPEGTFELGDLRELSRYESASFDVVFASFNVIDVLDDAERREVLAQIHRMLAPDGLLMMSSHNLAHAPSIPRPTHIGTRNPVRIARELLRMPRRERNRRRLLPLQREHGDYAILTDEAHEYGILHYYIGRDAQARQLVETGFALLECLDLDARPVAAGEAAPSHPELHYVARRVEPSRR
ncbi:MAG TPA: class I SAM-dependent methyltransferase [Solirubrobacteraceae bacterium]|nr:class I SAM-dependent methyltransferase [Solirubrobacteraceae bacterium]